MKAFLISGLICWVTVLCAAEADSADWEKLSAKLSVDFVQRLARSGETNARPQAVVEALDRATAFRDFHEKSPTSEHAVAARRAERAFLSLAAGYGSTNANELFHQRWTAAVAKAGDDRRAKLELAAELAQHRVHLLIDLNDPADIEAHAAAKADAVVEAGRKLTAEFPAELTAYERWFEWAELVGRSKAVAEEILKRTDITGAVRDKAKEALEREAMLSRPLELSFTALDGREIDLAKLRGKVVLIDFWATWHDVCVSEMKTVRQAYERFHERGFEVIGVIYNQEKSEGDGFVAKEKIPWPQFWDGEGLNNAVAEKFGVGSLPTKWLIGKDGRVVDRNARANLMEKVEKILAAPAK
jgi:peroxiredoxin